MEPAKNIIELCGGVDAVAGIVGRDVTRIRRWTYPKERGGTGGLIPSDCAQVLMSAAVILKLPLKPEHFFPAGSK